MLAALAGARADAQEALAAAEEAFDAVRAHGRKRDRDTEIRAAADAVRLARWLATPEEPPGDAGRELRPGCSAPGPGPTAPSPRSPAPTPAGCRALAQVYAALWERARNRRAELDADFARRLAAWTEASSASDDLLLVENLLDRIARPVAEQRPPVIVVLDGMTAAAGIELAGELTSRGGWLEGGRREDGREPVLATVPSVTAISRTSLLTGTLRTGDQAQEKRRLRRLLGQAQVRALPQGRPRPRARPFPGQPGPRRDRQRRHRGRRRPQRDRRRPGQGKARPGPLDPGSRSRTCARSSTRLAAPAARSSSPPTTATSSTRGDGPQSPRAASRTPPATARVPRDQARSPCAARASSSTGRERVVAAVDETIHYTPRRAGYHGGASLAEVVVPVITLLPSDSPAPARLVRLRRRRPRPCLVGRPGVARHAAAGPGQAPDSARPAPAAPQAPRRPLRPTGTRSSTSPTRHPRSGSRRSLRSPSAARSSRRPGWRASGRRSPGPPPRPTSPR